MPSLLLVSKDKLLFGRNNATWSASNQSPISAVRPKFISVCRKYHVHKIMPLRCGMPGFCLLRICNYPVLQLEYEATPAEAL